MEHRVHHSVRPLCLWVSMGRSWCTLCWQRRESSTTESPMPQYLPRWWLEVVCLSQVRNQVYRRKSWTQIEQREPTPSLEAPGTLPGCPVMTARLSIGRAYLSQRSSPVSPWASHQRCLALSSYKTRQVIEEVWWHTGSDLGIICLLVFFLNVFTSHFFWTKSWSVFWFIWEA